MKTMRGRVRRSGRRRGLAVGVACVLLAAATGCSVQAGTIPDGASGQPRADTTQPGQGQQGGATTEPNAGGAPGSASPSGNGGPTPGLIVHGADGCRGLASGPWSPIPHGPDPLGAVRNGKLPALIPGADGTPLDQITEFPALGDYQDPSTLGDPGRVRDAFDAAGYLGGIEARYEHGDEQTVVTVVRFRDAAGAGAALTAHLVDYCHRAVDARELATANGLLVLRDSASVRTLFVLDDIEVSVLVCSCFGKTDEIRQALVGEWASQITAVLEAGGSDPGPL